MASSGPKPLVAPAPPTDLATITLQPVAPPQPVFYRLSHEDYSAPLFFSRKGIYRFDSLAAKWGVCYLGYSIETAALEVFADRIRAGRIAFSFLNQRYVWRITLSSRLKLLDLHGHTLPRIRATVQSFVSRYKLSQEWGKVLMEHPADLDGLLYTGRQSGGKCLAMFGDTDPKLGRAQQSALAVTQLGRFSDWTGFAPFLDHTRARVMGLPAAAAAHPWSE